MNWPKSLTKIINKKVNLAKFTSFKIGGEAEFFTVPKNIAELRKILVFAKIKKIPVHILGGGSNILISDNGVKGIVIKIDAKFFRELYKKQNSIVAGSGINLSRLVLFAREKGLGGLEFLAGIPGSVGGSLVGNAGAWGSSIGDFVDQVCVLSYDGKKKLLNKDDLKFSYRLSNLGKYIVLWARLKLAREDKDKIYAKIREHMLARKKSQNDFLPSAGCIFKNPSAATSAGKLIDLCGLKGKRKLGAMISKVHANFILNLGNAKASDVLWLMDLIRKKVRSRFNIELAEEVKLWN